MTEPLQRLPCGCSYRGTRWEHLCDPHEAEWREVHERWAADSRRKKLNARQQKEIDDLLA